MTPEQKYSFDLTGLLILDHFLTPECLTALNGAWPDRIAGRDMFDVNFAWGEPWTALLALDSLRPVLQTLLGKGFRVDHAFGVSELFYSTKGRMHHQSHLVDLGVTYTYQRGRPYTSLLTLSVALVDIPAGAGGFCCVPGSHKANVDCPSSWFEIEKHPHMMQIPQKAGSAVLFTEALTHGTYHLGHEQPRRSIIMRLTPGGVQFRRNPNQPETTLLPPTPGWDNSDFAIMRPEQLSEAARNLVMRPPFFIDFNGRTRE